MHDIAYEVAFASDLHDRIADGTVEVLEAIRRPAGAEQPPRCVEPRHVAMTGPRLRLALGPDTTADDTYSAVEVSSSPCVDQTVLDEMLASGSERCMVPGREARFEGLVFSPHFADSRAAGETVNVGVIVQSWRGHLGPERQRLVAMAFTYVGGRNLFAAMTSRSLRKRYFTVMVTDFNTGIVWTRVLRGFDPTTPHSVVIRWLPDRDVEFRVDDDLVARYTDGARSVSPLKLHRRFGKGINWFGYRHLTADPCSITAFVDCASVTPDFSAGRQFRHDLWAELTGFAICPIPRE